MDVNVKPEYLIESLWILESHSGVCIFEENYVDFTNEGLQTDIVVSFLTALLTFAGEAFADQIQHIQFSNRKIVFRFTKYFLFVIAIGDSKEVSQNQINHVSDKIISKFNERYEDMFEKKQWKGNITVFKEFSIDLQEIVKKEPLKLKFFELFDFKDSFKKLERFMKEKRKQVVMKIEKLDSMIEEIRYKRDGRKQQPNEKL